MPEVHRGDFDRANVVLRDMHRAPAVFDATQRNADFVTAEEEWCWRSSYIASLIAIAAHKAGSIIVCVATKGQTETLADELRSSGRARHARLGWALPAVYAYRAGRRDRAAVERFRNCPLTLAALPYAYLVPGTRGPSPQGSRGGPLRVSSRSAS